MTAWMTDQLSDGKPPSVIEIKQKAARVMMQIKSDPWFYQPGGSSDEFSGIAAYITKLSPVQRSQVTVDIENIPDFFLKEIKAKAQAWGVATVDDDLAEELAGAILANDKERLRKLLNEARGD
jgi:hypothetical protein